ncbi:hypothetical protein AB0L56_04320 [Streptomyces sp. NPDC052079]|uniref:hypothetical protein n=1 Tax=unclassified Streptomyces TaxID=2593676 RepID=UPI00167CDE40|nr:hypothetical protein GCM10010297_06470 [Streptomyces malachitofuscus]
MTANRVVWFAVAFAIAAPGMSAVFREHGRLTGRAMALGIVFATSIAVIVAIAVGRGAS